MAIGAGWILLADCRRNCRSVLELLNFGAPRASRRRRRRRRRSAELRFFFSGNSAFWQSSFHAIIMPVLITLVASVLEAAARTTLEVLEAQAPGLLAALPG